jgi:hypothetical protein
MSVVKPRREPSAAMIAAANQMREMFEALLQAGFTESQALTMIGQALGTMAATSQADPKT